MTSDSASTVSSAVVFQITMHHGEQQRLLPCTPLAEDSSLLCAPPVLNPVLPLLPLTIHRKGCSSSREVDESNEAGQITSSIAGRGVANSQTTSASTSALAADSASQTRIHHRHNLHQQSSQSNLSSSRLSSSVSHPDRGRRSSATPVALETPINLPLRCPSPFATPQPFTPKRLACERQEFWETRVTGRPEVWSAIRNACELACDGQLENARGILEAAGVTLPSGSLVAGGYDEVGGLYRVPDWVIGTPTNLLRDNNNSETTRVVTREKQILLAEQEVDKDETDRRKSLERRRDEKGKAKAVVDEDAVKVRCRLSDRGGPDAVIWLGRKQPVSVLARRVRDEAMVRCFILFFPGSKMPF